jgi:hypothetical protein
MFIFTAQLTTVGTANWHMCYDNNVYRYAHIAPKYLTFSSLFLSLDIHRNMKKLTEIYLLTLWSRIFFEKLIVIQLIKKYPAFFTEPEGSSPCSQKPATGPYPEPAESS